MTCLAKPRSSGCGLSLLQGHQLRLDEDRSQVLDLSVPVRTSLNGDAVTAPQVGSIRDREQIGDCLPPDHVGLHV